MNKSLPQINVEELARRRASARRVAWLLGAGVLLLYIVGFFVKR